MFKLNRHVTILAALIIAIAFAATQVGASGSKEKEQPKSPKNEKQEAMKNATEHYNVGVKHMEKAREKAAMADSNFAFNYRATSDAKAKREYEKAVDEFIDAIKYNPDFVEAHNNLGYCYRKLGMLDESLKHYHLALKIDSTFEQAREYLGETYLALDSLNLAMSQHDWLASHKSIYADTLAQSIELYRLKNVSQKMKDSGGK